MKRTVLITLLSALLIFAFTLGGCGRPAQIGKDRETFKAVDALYTAVSLRDPQLLQRCDQTLQSLRTSGKLAKAAHDSLESIVSEARAGKWEDAQSRLGDFMRGQRR
jgi:hypothetical protein